MDLPEPCLACNVRVTACLGGVDRCQTHVWVARPLNGEPDRRGEKVCKLHGPGKLSEWCQVRFSDGEISGHVPTGCAVRRKMGRRYNGRMPKVNDYLRPGEAEDAETPLTTGK